MEGNHHLVGNRGREGEQMRGLSQLARASEATNERWPVGSGLEFRFRV